ncbi:MAG: cytochrome C [Mariprofundales bacterium]|nr:cytochrome C [Mariprofundales bacterium]
MKKILMMAAAAAFVAGTVVATPTSADAAAYNKCKACHNFSAKKKVGPGWGKGDTGHGTQSGIFDREAGASPGFRYKFTKYIKDGKAWKWDEAHLRKWMCNSKDAVKEFTGNPKARTKMPPQHVCDPSKQNEVIAFMKTLS